MTEINMEKQKMETNEMNKVIGKGLLVCDHCKKKKQCEKIIYNQFGNVVFICEDCKRRCR